MAGIVNLSPGDTVSVIGTVTGTNFIGDVEVEACQVESSLFEVLREQIQRGSYDGGP